MGERLTPMSATEQARANRCSAWVAGKCVNGFPSNPVNPYCVGTLHPERTPKAYWPECLRED